jgi:Flp pilus assembly protein TadG
MTRSFPPTLRRRRRPGQALPLTALVLPVLLAFTLLVVEAAERRLEVTMVEDALQQATRSAVQSLDYAAFARGEAGLRAGEPCVRQTLADAAGGPCADVIAVADRFLRVNLRGAHGLVGATPEAAIDAVAAGVEWTVMPAGGGCAFRSGAPVPDEPTPLICAEVHPTMEGLVGWGHYTPAVIAADRLDPIAP